MSNATAPPPGQPGPRRSDNHYFTADPLLRGNSFIEPNSSAAGSRGTNGVNQPPSAPPSSSGNGEPEKQFKPERKRPQPPPPGSDLANLLPPGWLVEDRVRISGATAGSVDKYYIEPTTGRRFRSLKEVQYYLETGTVRQKKKPAENSDGDANSSGVSGNQKNKKSATKVHLNFDYSNVPDATEWFLTDVNQDAWTPFIGGLKVSQPEKQSWDAELASLTAKNINKTF